MIAEDNIDNQYLAQTILQKSGYSTDIAENGQITFELFRKIHYDLILMDVQMPVVDGFEAARKIRKYEKEHSLKPIPIIALTAHAMEDCRKECLNNGMDDYVTKPLTKDTLLDAVDKWISKEKIRQNAG